MNAVNDHLETKKKALVGAFFITKKIKFTFFRISF
jgi:hypothetical protein